ncbi:MAG: hypothetical protein ABEJ90_01840 [Halobacterium sp.]
MSDDDRDTLREQDPLRDVPDDVDDAALDALLCDYQTAAEGGRYRDRFLHYTYYLAIVALGLVLNFGYTLYSDAQNSPLVWAVFAAGAAVVFFVLLTWSESFRHARNACWARQSEIEEYLESIQPGLVRSNDSVPNRLQYDYQYGRKSELEQLEIAKILRYLFLVLVVVFVTVSVVGFARWLG